MTGMTKGIITLLSFAHRFRPVGVLKTIASCHDFSKRAFLTASFFEMLEK